MMPDGIHQNRQRDTLLRLPLGDLVGWQLLVTCDACRADRIVMVGELVARHGSERTLAMLVPRLRCREAACRRPPAGVVPRNRYPAQMGGPGFVEVMLKGDRRP